MNLGFIGLGRMGAAMAANLLNAGHTVTIWNRSRDKMAPLVERGARGAARLEDACRQDVVWTMLADDLAMEDVAFGPDGILHHLPKGAVHVSSTTMGVAMSRRLAKAHQEKGQGYVAAPVFGRPTAAAARQLVVVAAGAADVIDRLKPLFEAVGHKTAVMSEDPAAANLVKLSGNFMIASVMEQLGEALALVQKGGVDPQRYLDLLTSTLFDAPVYKTYGGLIVKRQFEPPGFAAPMGEKDIRLVLAAAQALQVPMPLAGLLHDRFLRLLAQGDEKVDWAAIGRLPSDDAGLP